MARLNIGLILDPPTAVVRFSWLLLLLLIYMLRIGSWISCCRKVVPVCVYCGATVVVMVYCCLTQSWVDDGDDEADRWSWLVVNSASTGLAASS
jgi:hypothetical protein